ncbi:hypothetical protein MMC30_008237 [Trapelia coarctata]|nr:hypothetical protein [Trapelia coarctata]
MSFPTPEVPGLDPDANYGPQMNSVAAAFLCLSVAVIALRFFSRVYTRIEVGTDDWLIVAAAVFSWAYTIEVIVEVQQNYYGQHIGKSDPYHLTQFFKGLYGLAIIYPVALSLSKLSLLALYWRIFRVTTARLPMQIAAALNIGWGVAAFLVGIFSCTPVQGFWDFSIESKCINYNVFFLSNEAFTITLDLVVLLMPIYFIKNIQRSVSQRVSISSTFLLGLVVTVVSAVRLWRLVDVETRPGFDPTFNLTDAALWAIIELDLWLIVASIPCLRPLVGKVIQNRSSYGSNSTPRSYPYKPSFSSLRSRKARHWPSQGSTSSHPHIRLAPSDSHAHIASNEEEAGLKRSNELSWTDVRSAPNRRKDIPLEDLPGIRVEREFEVVQPERAYHPV